VLSFDLSSNLSSNLQSQISDLILDLIRALISTLISAAISADRSSNQTYDLSSDLSSRWHFASKQSPSIGGIASFCMIIQEKEILSLEIQAQMFLAIFYKNVTAEEGLSTRHLTSACKWILTERRIAQDLSKPLFDFRLYHCIVYCICTQSYYLSIV